MDELRGELKNGPNGEMKGGPRDGLMEELSLASDCAG